MHAGLRPARILNQSKTDSRIPYRFKLSASRSSDDTEDTIVRKVRKAFEKPFDLDGTPIFVGVSTGYAMSETSDLSISALFERADRALRATKGTRRLISA